VLEKAGCYITKTEIDEILHEFELKAGDTMNYDKFKEIIFCKIYLGFSAENSVGSSHKYGNRRRLSHKRLSSPYTQDIVINKIKAQIKQKVNNCSLVENRIACFERVLKENNFFCILVVLMNNADSFIYVIGFDK